jgi:hypothetical protein
VNILESLKTVSYRKMESIFGQERMRKTYQHFRYGSPSDQSIKGQILLRLVLFITCFVNIESLKDFALKVTKYNLDVYDLHRLNLITQNIYNLPKVVVSEERIATVNVLVPAFSVQTVSAGFFGVFQLALKISRLGYHVRLVMFDNFNFNEDVFRKLLKKTTGLETLLDEVELSYIGDRYKPLKVSSQDINVATVWYSAYFAEKISKLANNQPFLYLIQDYEAAFYPYNSLYALADATYTNMNYYGLVSSEPLFNYLKASGKCDSKFAARQMIFFNNACAHRALDKKFFIQRQRIKTRKFVFYSRPTVDRNMFHLACLAIIKAFNEGVFDKSHNWEFYGMGIGEVEIYLDRRKKLTQLPRMSLQEYEIAVQSFDVCLSLMASPHPSLLPFDLAGSGAIVVTNIFQTKTKEYFSNISKNIIAVPPNVDDLVFAIKEAVQRAELFAERYDAAIDMSYPKSWDQTWTREIEQFITTALHVAHQPQLISATLF